MSHSLGRYGGGTAQVGGLHSVLQSKGGINPSSILLLQKERLLMYGRYKGLENSNWVPSTFC